ncbi:MAG TPA: 5'-3' exonuclease H3TH domain-containing protein [Patescibacteria group bacterium]|nr:5'-3' exonuclease H3TH domain-containing protein [Patescibacteria group bacterium]
MKKLLLIDGNAMMHRAYHALPPLTNTKGEPVNAVYGFFSMLLNVIVDQEPTHLVVCFDTGAPRIRESMFAGYHAHRQALPDDFVPQIELIHELLAKMKVAVFELDGYEGDDLIGTIADKAVTRSKSKGQSLDVVILTGDRDLLQLVNGHVQVLMPLVGITKTVMFDAKAVEEKYGVTPSQFIDYKALIGDPSDGYPGVTGIGPKTAASLLQKFHTFENLYKNIGEVPEKVGLKLATDAEQAALAKKLATIILDAPIQFDLPACAVANFDAKALLAGFKEQGFKNLTARYETVFGKPEEQLGLL